MKTELACNLRWFIRRDYPEVLEIERQSFEFSWTEDDFHAELRQRNINGMVAEHEGRVVGFMVYALLADTIQILNFAVSPSSRRQGVGSQMVAKMICKLRLQRRERLRLYVRETNLSAQLFFKSQGFKACGMIRGHYEDSDEDAYVMRYELWDSP